MDTFLNYGSVDNIGSSGLVDLTSNEINQLKNINSTSISPANWSYMSVLDQNLAQTSNVSFAGIDATTLITDNADPTKKISFDISGITTANTRTITMPDEDLILVGRDNVQTLINKSLSDSTTTFIDNDDITKKAKLELSGITTSTTRTLTLQDLDGTIKLNEVPDNILANMKKTGFASWNDAGNYYSWSSPTLTLLRGGTGYINSTPLTFASGQTIDILEDTTNTIYIDSSGIIQKTTTSNDAFYQINIPLFECFRDGTSLIIKKENHNYSLDTTMSRFLHNNIGTIVLPQGSILSASATPQKIDISAGSVIDHDLQTTFTTLSNATFCIFYLNASGKWKCVSASTDTVPSQYNSAGTVTALSANKFGVFAVYLMLDDLNSSTPQPLLVMDDAEYNTQTLAINAINAGSISVATNELLNMEPALIGFIIYSQAAADISSIIVKRATINAQYLGASANGSHLLLADLNAGPYLDGNHSNLVVSKISASSSPTVNDDTLNYKKGTLWIREDTDNMYINVDNTSTASVWKEVVDINTSQGLTNKTLTSAIINTPNIHNNIITQNTSTTLTTAQSGSIIKCDSHSGITLTLPTITSANDHYYIINEDTDSTLTISANSTDKIDSATLTGISLPNRYDRVHLTSNGNGTWYSF